MKLSLESYPAWSFIDVSTTSTGAGRIGPVGVGKAIDKSGAGKDDGRPGARAGKTAGGAGVGKSTSGAGAGKATTNLPGCS